MVPALVESLQMSTDRARPLFIVTAGDTGVADAVRLYDLDHDGAANEGRLRGEDK